MIKLSQRLLAIASLVRSDSKIVDIGCDHALLDIYLVQHNHNLKSIAVDVREGAIKQAQKNIIKYNMSDEIDLRLGDGLNVVDKDEVDTIVISGLGGPKIVDILTNNRGKLDNVNDLIIQSNTDYYDLRKSVCELGYFIVNEKLVLENDIIYVIIHFQRGNKDYSDDDYLFGPILKNEKSGLYKQLLTDDLNKKEILYKQIPQEYSLKRQQIEASILKLKKEIK